MKSAVVGTAEKFDQLVEQEEKSADSLSWQSIQSQSGQGGGLQHLPTCHAANVANLNSKHLNSYPIAN